MNNPYDVLGVTVNSTDEEIKKAYKEKARAYAGNAAMLNELDIAYDSIIMSRTENTQSGSYYEYNRFDDIRAKIGEGRIDDAETLLDSIPVSVRNAEWYFLKGTVHQRRGWLESAAECFGKAYELEPSNRDYKKAYESFSRSRSGAYGTHMDTEEKTGCFDSPCRLCSSLLCADCCCECFGGDLIRCC